MIIQIEIADILVVFNRRYELDEFRQACSVANGSYADELVARIHNCLFRAPRDVVSEYDKYYAREYTDLAGLLYWKYSIGWEQAQQIRDRASTGSYVGFGRDSVGLFEDKSVDAIIKEILSKLGECEDEDTNRLREQ